jgi:hypothetical protein
MQIVVHLNRFSRTSLIPLVPRRSRRARTAIAFAFRKRWHHGFIRCRDKESHHRRINLNSLRLISRRVSLAKILAVAITLFLATLRLTEIWPRSTRMWPSGLNPLRNCRAGTVVILDSSKSNQVIASTQPYDSRVAGVISLQPGLVLGEPGEGRVLVATTGRVKVKVDATNGPIKIGDLLVTSAKPAWRRNPARLRLVAYGFIARARSLAKRWNHWPKAPAKFSSCLVCNSRE